MLSRVWVTALTVWSTVSVTWSTAWETGPSPVTAPPWRGPPSPSTQSRDQIFLDHVEQGASFHVLGVAAGEEAFRAHLFVGALGASGCAYAEATRSESLPDWLASHVRALEF